MCGIDVPVGGKEWLSFLWLSDRIPPLVEWRLSEGVFQLFVGGGDSSPVCRTGGVLRRTGLIDNLAAELGVWGGRKRCVGREGALLFPRVVG